MPRFWGVLEDWQVVVLEIPDDMYQAALWAGKHAVARIMDDLESGENFVLSQRCARRIVVVRGVPVSIHYPWVVDEGLVTVVPAEPRYCGYCLAQALGAEDFTPGIWEPVASQGNLRVERRHLDPIPESFALPSPAFAPGLDPRHIALFDHRSANALAGASRVMYRTVQDDGIERIVALQAVLVGAAQAPFDGPTTVKIEHQEHGVLELEARYGDALRFWHPLPMPEAGLD